MPAKGEPILIMEGTIDAVATALFHAAVVKLNKRGHHHCIALERHGSTFIVKVTTDTAPVDDIRRIFSNLIPELIRPVKSVLIAEDDEFEAWFQGMAPKEPTVEPGSVVDLNDWKNRNQD